MLKLVLVTLLVAAVAAVLGYEGIAESAVELSLVFMVVFAIVLVAGLAVAAIAIRMQKMREQRRTAA
jgi:uncharacterized membrane protein YtjA (UPF0391 family)